MPSLRQFCARFASFFRRRRLEAEMAEEMRQHLERRIQEKTAAGLAPDEARHAALREFGGIAQVQEQCRDEHRFVWLEQFLQDLHYAGRQLRRTPGFAVVAVLTLATGIGASTALFTALDAILFRSLPARESDRLTYFVTGTLEQFSFPFYERMRQAATSFSALSVVQHQTTRNEFVVDGGGAESARVQSAAGNFFATLGVTAQLGRTFRPDDDRAGAAQPVVVLSDTFWRGRFGADAAVIGRRIELEGIPATIIGVMPAGFGGFEIGADPDLWAPLQLVTQVTGPVRHSLAEGVEWLVLFGRLGDGVSSRQAEAEVSAIFRRQLEDEVARNPNRPPAERERMLSRTLELRSGAAGYVAARSQFTQPLIVLTIAVGVVLAIACTNIAGLLLARGAARQREVAVRAALGAGRARIIRQLVTESVLLGMLGGALGLLIAQGGTRLLASYIAQSGPAVPLTPDLRVLGFAVIVSLLTGVLFGLVPALRLSRVNLAGGMDQGRTVAGTRSRLQPALVVAQVALSVLLLAGAGLFVRTLHNLRSVDLGFVPDNLIVFGLDSGRWRPDATQIMTLQQRLLAELETLPGVRGVSLGGFGMLSGNRYNATFAAEGYEPAPDEELRAAVLFAGPHFFATTGTRLIRGREFTLADTSIPAPHEPPRRANVTIIGEALAQRYFGNTDPIGRQITLTGRMTQPLEIVGVAKDTKYTRNLREAAPLEFYLPYFGGGMRTPTTFYVRCEHNVAAIGPDIRRVVTRVEPRLGVRDLRPMDEAIDRLLVRERIITELVGFFSAFALVLAALGIYGVLAYAVTQRTREIGVRMALGANLRDVVALVLRQGLGLAFAGCVIGVGAALGATRFATSLLYAVKPADPLTFASVTGLLAIVALVACWLPARRAGKVDPIIALRAE
jgi:predicted permease